MTEICPGLYLGPIGAAYDSSFLRKHKIKAVIGFCYPSEHAYYRSTLKSKDHQPDGIEYYPFPIQDDPGELISYRFRNISDLIACHIQANQSVLVHCYMGVSRSTTFVLAYLMRSKGMSYEHAFQYVQKRRPIINPNPGFIAQLKIYEKELSYVT